MKSPLRLFAALLLPLFLAATSIADPIRVACVGDSITYGAGAAPGWAYPSQLQRMLGAGYEVRNFGVSGTTLLRHGDVPYEKQRAFKDALAYQADIVVLMLGTNDTKAQNWGPHRAEFERDYRWMVAQLQGTNASQKLFVCRPCWVADGGAYGINEKSLEEELPIIDKLAESLSLKEIDMYAVFQGHPEYLPDHVHPNNTGATLMAKAACKAITGKDFVGEAPSPAAH